MSTNLFSASQITPKILVSTRVAGTTATTLYTVPASTTAKISQGTLCNTGANPVSIDMAIVPSGGTDNGTHNVVSAYSLAAHDTLPLQDYLGDMMLGPADFVSVTCSLGAVVTVVLTGTEHI